MASFWFEHVATQAISSLRHRCFIRAEAPISWYGSRIRKDTGEERPYTHYKYNIENDQNYRVYGHILATYMNLILGNLKTIYLL